MDVACFQRRLDKCLRVGLQQDGLRNGANVVHVVRDNREAHGHSACTKCQRAVVHRGKRVHESMQTHIGVLHEAVPVATFDGTEDHSGAHAEGHNVAYRPDVGANAYDANMEAQLNAHALGLVNDVAHQEHEDTALLITANQVACFLVRGSGIDDNNEARNVVGNQRHAQLTHFSVGEVTVILRALVRRGIVHVLHSFDDFTSHSGTDAGLEDGLGALIARAHGVDVCQSGLEVLQLENFLPRVSQLARHVVCSVRHLHRGVFTILSDSCIYCLGGNREDIVGAMENPVKKFHMISFAINLCNLCVFHTLLNAPNLFYEFRAVIEG